MGIRNRNVSQSGIKKRKAGSNPASLHHYGVMMKPRNFPARKLARQLRAQGICLHEAQEQINAARTMRSKKLRSTKK